jgi:hypothetical protein
MKGGDDMRVLSIIPIAIASYFTALKIIAYKQNKK